MAIASRRFVRRVAAAVRTVEKLPLCSQLRRHTLDTSSRRRRVLSALSPLRWTYSIHGADPLLLHSRGGGQSACRGRRGEQDNGRIHTTHLR